MRPNVTIANTMVRMNGILLRLTALVEDRQRSYPECLLRLGESAGIVIANSRYRYTALSLLAVTM
jgi:hypothetical protein